LTTSNRSVDFNFTEALSAGETLEFAEGPNSSGGYSSDSTGFDVTVSSVPEPESVALLCTALAAFGVIRRRKTAQARSASRKALIASWFLPAPQSSQLSDVECFDCYSRASRCASAICSGTSSLARLREYVWMNNPAHWALREMTFDLGRPRAGVPGE
jgi:hypothetical protein